MGRQWTLAGMRRANIAAGHHFFEKGNAAFFDETGKKIYYDGMNNYICVFHRSGKKSWYTFNPKNGHIHYLNARDVPAYIREKA